ncbi:hypothetical protein BFF94_010340 [Burkholderia catarinensis]|nr:hypothetical protein BFF94_010340 [Burkholderia catarinensis]
MPDGGLHAGGGGRCRCTHVAVSVRLSSGARHGCRCARRAIARSTGMQERGQRESARCVVTGQGGRDAMHHFALQRQETIWQEACEAFAAAAKRRIG